MTAPTDRIDLPTPRTTLAARYVRVMLTCWHCRHQADAETAAVAMSAGAAALALRTVQEQQHRHGGD
jgi:hypothetical protein